MTVAGTFDRAGTNAPIAAGRHKSLEFFSRYLRVVQANSSELLDHVFRLRYQVYCLERGFENPAEYPDGRERDHDDYRSTHFLVLYRDATTRMATAAGTVRFIMPRPHAELPVLRLIENEQRRAIDLPFETTAEISRFAIAKSFRKRLEKDLRAGLIRAELADGAGARATTPLLTFGLLRAVMMMSVCGGITHIVAMMEPALLRLLSRLGIEFNAIGDPVEHHGRRQPVWAAMAQVVENVRQNCPELWEFATNAGRELPAPAGSANGNSTILANCRPLDRAA